MRNRMKKVTTLLALAAITVSVSLGSMPLTAKAADKAGINAFVTRMYEVCLNREPDEAGLADWTKRLESGQAKGSDIAYGFIFSEEFKNMNLCNDHYVDSMYESFFGREADAAGKADWVGQLNSGATKGHVMTGFINSQEFANLSASYGIDPGTGNWDGDNFSANGTCVKDGNDNNNNNNSSNSNNGTVANDKIKAFVNRLYENCLERKADEEGLNSWANALANGAEGSQVAAGFIFSDEYKLKDASDAQYVLMLYKTMLGREADTPGVTDWVLKIRETGSRETAFNGFLQSAEFKNLCVDAGINVGNPIADNHTTGRASTGEKVTVYEDVDINGEVRRQKGTLTEGTLYDPKPNYRYADPTCFNYLPDVNVETQPFIAYEGAVTTTHVTGNMRW